MAALSVGIAEIRAATAQPGERVVRNDEVGGSIPPGSTNSRSAKAVFPSDMSMK